ncbi:hypothetical protein M5689_009487 [Euphorbia peplus]|nr:hypothetical protein M5689_009487 [Euphorbia peplus]
MPENERLAVAPSPRRRSLRIARKGMPSNEISTEATKSNLVKAPKEMPLKEKLREAPTPSVTKSNPGCQKELMPMKERCEETPSVTMKKPKKMESLDTMVSRNNYNMALGDAKMGLELYQKKNKVSCLILLMGALTLTGEGLECSSFNIAYALGAGLKHDCLICGDRRITHPVRGDYVIGAPPYKISGLVFSGIKTGNDVNRGGGGDFVAGFLLGGAVCGTLAYIFAPQIRRSLLNEDEYGFRRAKRPIYYDEGLEKTRQTLNAKISQLNNAIDKVSSRLRGGNNSPPSVPVENDPEVEATI